MRYMGSKNKIAKHLLPEMLRYRNEGQYWVEPFVGGANMIDKVEGKRIGNDANRYLIALLKAVQLGWDAPEEISRQKHNQIKNNKNNYEDELVGFVGFLCSFGANFFSGYAQDKEGTNYALRGKRALEKQRKNIDGVDFQCGDYTKMKIPDKSLVYCDPPYKGVIGYSNIINHDVFFDWCREKSKEGHTVFVSEYSAPDDFILIKEIDHQSIINVKKQKKTKERLFLVP